MVSLSVSDSQRASENPYPCGSNSKLQDVNTVLLSNYPPPQSPLGEKSHFSKIPCPFTTSTSLACQTGIISITCSLRLHFCLRTMFRDSIFHTQTPFFSYLPNLYIHPHKPIMHKTQTRNPDFKIVAECRYSFTNLQLFHGIIISSFDRHRLRGMRIGWT